MWKRNWTLTWKLRLYSGLYGFKFPENRVIGGHSTIGWKRVGKVPGGFRVQGNPNQLSSRKRTMDPSLSARKLLVQTTYQLGNSKFQIAGVGQKISESPTRGIHVGTTHRHWGPM